ncbi:MAG: SDR family NAD(P)-dependent oxidoreductase [Stackebrandtia sp.]
MSRAVLVTGGGTGLGRAAATRFAASGDVVFVTGRRADVLTKTAQDLAGDVRAVPCDHTDPAQLTRLADQLPDRLDVLINNAGGNTGIGAPDPEDLDGLAAAWRANLEANLISAVLTTRLLTDRLAEGGAAIHIGSIAADKGAGSYGAAKAALASWNVDLSRGLGARGVTSNVIAPGYVAETEFFGEGISEQRRVALIGATSTGRAGVPDDVAGAAWFLASPDARYITGQVLNVNGGAWPTR